MPVRPVTGRCLFAGSDKRSLLELSHALGCKVSVHLQCSCDFFCHCDLSVIPQMPSVSDSEIHLSSLKVVHGKGVCHIRVPFSAGGLIHSTVESSRCLPCGIICCNLQSVVTIFKLPREPLCLLSCRAHWHLDGCASRHTFSGASFAHLLCVLRATNLDPRRAQAA